ncbi:hypothetical protein, partial [Pseudomonas aeruginosa]
AFHQGSGVATPLHEAGYTDAVVHRFEIKTNTGKPGGVHIRITPTALSAAAALPADSGAALTPTLSLKREGILRTSVEFAVSNAADEPEP